MNITITGPDLVFASLIIGYFWYEITRIRALRDIAKLASEHERARPAPIEDGEAKT